jgi:hypothetical protein
VGILRRIALVIAVLAVARFDVATLQGFANVIGDVLKSQLNVVTAADVAYVRSILWCEPKHCEQAASDPGNHSGATSMCQGWHNVTRLTRGGV